MRSKGRNLERLRAGIHRSFASAPPVPGWGVAPARKGERYVVTGDYEHPELEGLVGEVIRQPVSQYVRLRFADYLVPGFDMDDPPQPAEIDVPWPKLTAARNECERGEDSEASHERI